jgi:hypothetical protein
MAYRFLAVVGQAAEGDVVAVPSRVGVEGVEVGQVDGENTSCDTVHQESSAGLPAPAGDEVNSRGRWSFRRKARRNAKRRSMMSWGDPVVYSLRRAST